MADALNLVLTDKAAAPTGARASFSDFVRRQEAPLRRYLASRLPNEDDVRELAQECLLRLLRYCDTHDDASLERIMFRIANNLLTDRWRSVEARHTRDHVPLSAVDLACDTPSQERQVAAQQRLARLKQVILDLPPKCQAVFVFSRIQGLSHAEIAAKCGVSVKTVEKHITKALAACRAAGCDDV